MAILAASATEGAGRVRTVVDGKVRTCGGRRISDSLGVALHGFHGNPRSFPRRAGALAQNEPTPTISRIHGLRRPSRALNDE